MLRKETVEPGTFSILEKLLSFPELSTFHLVGGTALSLLYGHRISIDLDLFSVEDFENSEIENLLVQNFPGLWRTTYSTSMGVFGFIGELKIDLVRYKHDHIKKIQSVEGIRMFSKEDILAMKIQAILNRAVKKDFWDIAEMLADFTVEDCVSYHQQKFHDQHLFISTPRAMTYFTDAEDDVDPISLKGQTWDSVKDKIRKAVNIYLK